MAPTAPQMYVIKLPLRVCTLRGLLLKIYFSVHPYTLFHTKTDIFGNASEWINLIIPAWCFWNQCIGGKL